MSEENFTDIVKCLADFQVYFQLTDFGPLPHGYITRYIVHDDGVQQTDSDETGSLEDRGLFKWRIYDILSSGDENNPIPDQRFIMESQDEFLTYAECIEDFHRFQFSEMGKRMKRRRHTGMHIEYSLPRV